MCAGQRIMNFRWAQQDSNLRRTSYEPDALTTELWALAECIVPYRAGVGKRGIAALRGRNSPL